MKPLNTIKHETFIIGTCPNCGQARLNNRDNNFCGWCGTEIEWEQGYNEPGIVRCQDCNHWKKLVLNRDGDGVCSADNTILVTHPEWYCADGERRTDDA